LISLKRALEHVGKLKPHKDQAIAVGQIKTAALACRYPLEDFLAKIGKYEQSLGLGRSSGIIKNSGKKIEWAFAREEEVIKLRNYLNIRIGTINMLLIQQGLEMLDMVSQLSERNQRDLQRCVEDCSRAVKDVRGDVIAQSSAIQENQSMIAKLFYRVSAEIRAPLRSLNEMVAQLWYVLVTMQSLLAVVAAQKLRKYLKSKNLY